MAHPVIGFVVNRTLIARDFFFIFTLSHSEAQKPGCASGRLTKKQAVRYILDKRQGEGGNEAMRGAPAMKDWLDIRCCGQWEVINQIFHLCSRCHNTQQPW
jgi:hypothetical protein